MNTPANNRTYPLALLFLLLTCAAILAGAIGPLLRAGSSDLFENDWQFIGAAVVSAIPAGVLGALVGLFHFDRLAGALSGLAAGAVLGPFATLLLAAGTRGLGIAAPAVAIGSGILLVLVWLIRPPARQ